jgi:hypothetical protein
MTQAIPAADVFALGLYLTDVSYHEIWNRGRPVIRQGYSANSMTIVNLTGEWSANIFSTFEVVAFSLPRSVLDEVAGDAGLKQVGNLSCDPGTIDPVVFQLAASILPAFQRSNEANALFLEYVVLALCVHLLERYGIGAEIKLCRGGLTPFQLRRAKDLIASDLAGNISLADIAGECGLSRQ